MSSPPHIAVVGAGIIGVSIAWRLKAAGARVTVIDAGDAGNAWGFATPDSFAWINASPGNPEPYFRLRIRAMTEWRRLAAAVPDIPLSWPGGLCWDLTRDELEACTREHGNWGYGIRVVGRAEAGRIEPKLVNPPDLALHVAEEGMVEPRAAALALLAAAQRCGARLVQRTAISALVLRNGAVVGLETTDGRLDADDVVLAAGTSTAVLAATTGVVLPLTAPPGLLAHSRPHTRLLEGLVLAPGLHMRQTADGRLVCGADFAGADPGDDPGATARALIERARAMLRGAEALAFEAYSVGERPTPADGFPVVGRANGLAGLYLAVMHSGITLAPAVGLFAAEEMLQGRRDPLLAPYGPSRFG